MSSPPRTIWPASGASIRVIRLMSVVLPAPFGPISAWRTPCGSSSSTSCATTSEPNFLLMFFTESTQTAENAVGKEHHHCDEQQADPEVPVLRVDARELVARHHVDDGADDAAVEAAGAAEDQDHQHVGGPAEGQRFQRNRRRGMREHRAGDARHHCGYGIRLAQVRL